MPEYTPDTDEVRAAWIWAHQVESWGGTSDGEGRPRTRIAEFDRWLADHDKEVAACTIEGYRDLIERTTKLHDYAMDEDDWDEHKRLVAALTNYAAAIRSGSEGDNR